ncbi:enolase C-terminal domain-like protein [Lacticaseibacillus parakribbianus]|uniref:enolase C-terminal domain-like protein n=1 Tax=Lacticaseibacillus parakribbianus TaxID=2970927 RepID=UPI0021CB0B19|nr:enolase C-terminal domain-like protein [Lacticaseibacillus parakribbianus]
MGPKVTEMQVYPIAGFDSMLLSLSGAHAPYFTRNIVVLKDSLGHVGIGEIHGGEYTCHQLESYIPGVVGQEVTHYRDILRQLRQGNRQAADDNGEGIQSLDIDQLKYVVQSETAVECALLDLLGQYLDLPLAALLGDGQQRDRVEFLGYMFYVQDAARTGLPYVTGDPTGDDWERVRRLPAMTPEAVVEKAKAAYARYGFKNFKLKGGVLAPEVEMATVQALHEAFPKAHINLDPNGSWPLATAIRLTNQYRDAITYMEDPCGAERGFSGRETMAAFRQATGCPVATNMIATNWPQFHHAVVQHAVDIVLADPHFWGLAGSIRMAQVLNDWGLTWGSHSNNHFDITLMTYAQVAAAAPGHITPVDTHFIWQDGQQLCNDMPSIQNGEIVLPNRPGLGITLNMAKLQAAHARYLALPVNIRDRHDEVAMQPIIPGWRFDPKRPVMCH